MGKGQTVSEDVQVNKMYSAPREPAASGEMKLQNPSCLRPASFYTYVFMDWVVRESI